MKNEYPAYCAELNRRLDTLRRHSNSPAQLDKIRNLARSTKTMFAHFGCDGCGQLKPVSDFEVLVENRLGEMHVGVRHIFCQAGS